MRLMFINNSLFHAILRYYFKENHADMKNKPPDFFFQYEGNVYTLNKTIILNHKLFKTSSEKVLEASCLII